MESTVGHMLLFHFPSLSSVPSLCLLLFSLHLSLTCGNQPPELLSLWEDSAVSHADAEGQP